MFYIKIQTLLIRQILFSNHGPFYISLIEATLCTPSKTYAIYVTDKKITIIFNNNKNMTIIL